MLADSLTIMYHTALHTLHHDPHRSPSPNPNQMTSGLKLELQTDFFKLQLPEVPSSLVVVLYKLERSRLNRNTPLNPHGPKYGTGGGGL